MMTDGCFLRVGLTRMVPGWLCILKSFSHASEGKTTSATESYEAHVNMYRFHFMSRKGIKPLLGRSSLHLSGIFHKILQRISNIHVRGGKNESCSLELELSLWFT